MIATLPLGDRLRRLDPGRTARGTALIAALHHRLIGGWRTRAGAATEGDGRAAAGWINFSVQGAAVLVAPLLVDGEVARAGDAIGAAAALAPIEPLVAALELVLGGELHPAGLDATPAAAGDDPILIRLEAMKRDGGDSVRHRLLLALSPDMVPAPLASLPAAPPPLERLRWRWSARLSAPSLRASRVAGLRRGDLLLLGKTRLLAQVSIGGGLGAGAELDINRGTMTLTDGLGDDGFAEREPADTAAPPPADLADIRLPVTVEIDGDTLSARQIAALSAGSVLPLPAGGGALTVRVVAGGATIGTGELVAIGDGFGVLLADAAPLPPQA